MGLLLREWRERGQVEFREASNPEDALQTAREFHKGRMQAVVFGGPKTRASGVDAVVSASEAGPSWSANGDEAPVLSGRARDAWAQVARELLELLLGARSTLRRQEVASAEPRAARAPG